MGKFQNKIIAISGEPVTGKGTNVRKIHEKLLEQGYKEENIHLVSTGEEFRKYFGIIGQTIRNIDDSESLKEIVQNDKEKILEDKELRHAIVEAIVKLKENGVELSTFSIEQANNMPELAGVRNVVDTIIDTKIKQMGEEIGKQDRPDEIWIIDSRLAFANIPEAFAVRLTCSPQIAGKRLMDDKTRGEEDKYESIEEATKEREKRREGEIARYKARYGVDLADENNYNMIIDTSYSSVEDISQVILDGLNRYVEGKYVPKKWASPKIFIPTQSIGDTWRRFYQYRRRCKKH